MLTDSAGVIATAYGLGSPRDEMVVSVRGELGRVWRLDTDEGSFAVKELLVRQLPGDVALEVAYQDAVLATGSVRMPRPIRTRTGDVVVDVDHSQVRVYEWVDLLPVDTTLDPVLVGSTLAAVHRVPALTGTTAERLVHGSGRSVAMDPPGRVRRGRPSAVRRRVS